MRLTEQISNYEGENIMIFNQRRIEETVLNEINKIPKTFDYNSNTLEKNKAGIGACVAVVSGIINEIVNANTVKQLKLALNAKKRRNRTASEYKECLENNIVFELYKYDNFIDIFNVLDSNVARLERMDFQKFYTLMLEDSQKKVISAKQLSQSNQAVRNLIIEYSHQDTESREYDFIFSSLKVQTVSYAMQSILYGQLELGNRQISTRDYFKQFSVKDNKAALDLVIMNEIGKRLSEFY